MKVLLFARAKDLIGAAEIDLAPPLPRTVGELRQRLMRDHPQAAGLLAKSALAVQEDFADDAVALSPEAEVALLPPVSGG